MGWQFIKQGKISIPFISTPPAIAAGFTLEVPDIDSAGIAKGASFILTSSQNLNEKDIKKIVKFNHF